MISHTEIARWVTVEENYWLSNWHMLATKLSGWGYNLYRFQTSDPKVLEYYRNEFVERLWHLLNKDEIDLMRNRYKEMLYGKHES